MCVYVTMPLAVVFSTPILRSSHAYTLALVQAALQNTQAQGAQIYDLMKLLAQHVENQASGADQSAVQDEQVA